MPKRKAPSGDTSSDDTSPSNRVTRSSKALGTNTPLLTRSGTGTPRKPSTKAAQTDSPKASPVPRVRARSPVKIDHAEESEGSDDELNLSPSKTRSRRSGPRVFLNNPQKKPPKPITPTTSQQILENDTQIPYIPDAIPTSPKAPAGKEHLAIPRAGLTSPIKSASGSAILHLPTPLPSHLSSCLNAQKRAIFAALQEAPELSARAEDDGEPLTNAIASQQLDALLAGTMARDEGNSCLILGPRGSGKSCLVERAIKALKDRPIVIRLSGWAQNNDRLAMREVARQLSEQTGQSYLNDEAGDADIDAENPFAEPDDVVTLPPPSHLPALISVLPTLSRPSVVILDSFDLFALHPRQSLLYCLLDTVQNCRAGSGSKGMVVIGVTARIDTINLLEKRVKSRFSGRTLRTAAPPSSEYWLDVAGRILGSPVNTNQQEWQPIWNASITGFMQDPKVIEIFRESFAMSRDMRTLGQILMNMTSQLTPKTPFPQLSNILTSVTVQRSRPTFHFLSGLPYPSMCLLVAAMHARTAGQDIVTFEMLHETFRDQLRSSTSAPVEVEGGGIGMVRCTREVLRRAFEMLVTSRIFVATAASSATTAAEFVKYRCALDYVDVKKAVDHEGQTNLKKWLSKSQ